MSNDTRSSFSRQGSSPWPMNTSTINTAATPTMPSDYTPRMTPPGAPARRLQRTSSSGSVTGPFRGTPNARRRLFSPPVTPPRTPGASTPSMRTMSLSPSPSVSSPVRSISGPLKDRVRELKRKIEALEAEKEELKRAMRRGNVM